MHYSRKSIIKIENLIKKYLPPTTTEVSSRDCEQDAKFEIFVYLAARQLAVNRIQAWDFMHYSRKSIIKIENLIKKYLPPPPTAEDSFEDCEQAGDQKKIKSIYLTQQKFKGGIFFETSFFNSQQRRCSSGIGSTN